MVVTEPVKGKSNHHHTAASLAHVCVWVCTSTCVRTRGLPRKVKPWRLRSAVVAAPTSS